MLMVKTRARISEDGILQARVTSRLPPGEHEVVIVVAIDERPTLQFSWEDLPRHEGEWDHTVSLRREDLYGDDGR